MMDRYAMRKSAYNYICEWLNKLPPCTEDGKELYNIPLDELKLLKEGLSDPSPGLVADIKKLFCPTIGEAEINAHLVTPFRDKP